jgi:hypothetical protein
MVRRAPDWVIGSDIFYGESLHPRLRRISKSNLAGDESCSPTRLAP